MEDITIIIRTVGERTETILLEMLQEWYGKENIYMLKNITPFSETLKQMILLAGEKKKKWTLVIDADVLFSKRKLDEFIKLANEIGEKYILEKTDTLFCILPDVYDKFLQCSRSAGVHMYYTSNLQKGLKYVNNQTLRSETFLLRFMAAEGYDSFFVKTTIGIHDFFQDYTDIVAKGILHSRKHTDIHKMIPKLKDLSKENQDFYWLLEGIKLGEKYKYDSDFRNDRTYIYNIITEAKLNIPCKKFINKLEAVNEIEEYVNIPYVEKMIPYMDNKFSWKTIKNEFLKLSLFKKIKVIKDTFIKTSNY